MKTTLTLFAILLSFAINAQVKFITQDLTEVRAIGDSLTANAKRPYIFKEARTKGKYSYELYYKNSDDETDNLYIHFKVRYIGASEDLEIEGIPEYQFYYVSGKFLDLYPFWNKFIDSEDSPEEISKKKSKYIIVDKTRYLFQKNSEDWNISVTEI